MAKPRTMTLEDARIMFRNFAGKEGKYNREGNRNFVVFIEDPEMEKRLKKDGWNVKYLNARDEDDVEQAYIQVSVNFRGRPPTVVMINTRGRTDLGEDEVEILDWVDIAHADLIINPYEWEVSGKSGVKAYLKSLFITVDEDELDLKYSQVPYAGKDEDPFPEGNDGLGVENEDGAFE